MGDGKKEDPRDVSGECVDLIDALLYSLRPKGDPLDRVRRDLKAITFGERYGAKPVMLGPPLRDFLNKHTHSADAVNANGDMLEFKTVKARKGGIGELIERWRDEGVKELGVPPDVLDGFLAMHSGRESAAQMCHDINYAADLSWHGIKLIPVPEMERDRACFANIRMMTKEEQLRIKEWKPLCFNFHLDKPAQIRGLKADMVLIDEAEELQRKSLAEMHLAGKISDTTLLKEFGIETGERGDTMGEDLELCCVRGCENEGRHSTIVNGTQQATMCSEHYNRLRSQSGRLSSKEPNIQELPRPGVNVDYKSIEQKIMDDMQARAQEETDRRMRDMILADMNRGSRPAYREPPSYVNTPADRTALYSHYCDRPPENEQLNPSRSAFACSELDKSISMGARVPTSKCPICDAIERGDLDPDKVRGHHEHSLGGVRKMISQKLSAMGLTGSKNQVMVNALIKRLREIDEEAARAEQAKFLGEVAADSMARSIAEAEDTRILREVEEKLRRKEEWEQAPNQSIINDLRGRGFPVDGVPEPKLRLPAPELPPPSKAAYCTGSDNQGAIDEQTRYYKQRCEAADARAESAVGKREQIKKLQEEVAELEKDRHVGSVNSLNDWLRKPMGSF